MAESLSAAGFDVRMGVCDLPTAFSAARGSGALHVGLCAEYDSLPGIGHACGHNIIAASAVGAAIGLAAVADDVGVSVRVLGTPGEEVGDAGGKILMIERGAFDGVHAAMMVHPAPHDVATPRLIASSTFDVVYTGKAAHAAMYPELGVNAADALTVAQTAIGLLRQHIRSTDRVHGIVTHGGDAPEHRPGSHLGPLHGAGVDASKSCRNCGPACTAASRRGRWQRARRSRLSAAARPTPRSCTTTLMVAFYRRNAEALGRRFLESGPAVERAAASTDMGNVSRTIPSIHPLIGIDSLPAVNHQPEFAAHCVTAAADRALVDGAIALAWTAIDMATDASQRARLLAALS